MSKAVRVLRAGGRHLRLGDMTPGARRGLLYLVMLGVLVNAGAYWLSARSVAALRTQQHAQCKFYADLGSAPLAARPSLLNVAVVSDARVAWHGMNCPGRIPAADPSFIRWARFYDLPYR
jgi:hypothetical protein